MPGPLILPNDGSLNANPNRLVLTAALLSDALGEMLKYRYEYASPRKMSKAEKIRVKTSIVVLLEKINAWVFYEMGPGYVPVHPSRRELIEAQFAMLNSIAVYLKERVHILDDENASE